MTIKKKMKLLILVVLIILMILFVQTLSRSGISGSRIGKSDLTVQTDKVNYEAGEKVNIIATRSSFPEGDQENYMQVSDCGFEIEGSHRWNIEGRRMGGLTMDCSGYVPSRYPQECIDYCKSYITDISKSESREIPWDQKICEAFGNLEDYHLIPAAPGSYTLRVSCSVANLRGNKFEGITWGEIGGGKDITIKEPKSCADKKIELTGAKYEGGKVAIDVKNIGMYDVDYIRFYIDGCGDKKMEDIQYTMHIEAGLKRDETKKYLITPKDACRYSKVEASIYECSDENMSNWYRKEISN